MYNEWGISAFNLIKPDNEKRQDLIAKEANEKQLLVEEKNVVCNKRFLCDLDKKLYNKYVPSKFLNKRHTLRIKYGRVSYKNPVAIFRFSGDLGYSHLFEIISPRNPM